MWSPSVEVRQGLEWHFLLLQIVLMLLDLLKMHLNLLFQAFLFLALAPELLFPKFFLFLFLWRRGHHHFLILREVLFGHDILEELE